jgi:hypothetical protein
MKGTNWSNLGEQFQWFFGAANDHFVAFIVGISIVAFVTALLGGAITFFIVRARRNNYQSQRLYHKLKTIKSIPQGL